jgi:hypothetical protein
MKEYLKLLLASSKYHFANKVVDQFDEKKEHQR